MTDVKYVDEWDLDDKSKLEVKEQLGHWHAEFFNRAGKHGGNIKIHDFKKDDLFFFTDCRDILGDNFLSSKEMESEERKRKRNVLMQIFLTELIEGKPFYIKINCSHCGFGSKELIPLGMAGYVEWCPECNRTSIDTYVPSMQSAVDILSKKLNKRNVNMDFEK